MGRAAGAAGCACSQPLYIAAVQPDCPFPRLSAIDSPHGPQCCTEGLRDAVEPVCVQGRENHPSAGHRRVLLPIPAPVHVLVHDKTEGGGGPGAGMVPPPMVVRRSNTSLTVGVYVKTVGVRQSEAAHRRPRNALRTSPTAFRPNTTKHPNTNPMPRHRKPPTVNPDATMVRPQNPCGVQCRSVLHAAIHPQGPSMPPGGRLGTYASGITPPIGLVRGREVHQLGISGESHRNQTPTMCPCPCPCPYPCLCLCMCQCPCPVPSLRLCLCTWTQVSARAPAAPALPSPPASASTHASRPWTGPAHCHADMAIG